jgi:NADP-dependent 3-hydroxy acid dehydrogenase YdfG
MNIKDKTAIVTGASSGIGLSTAQLLSKTGAKVALVSRSKEKLEKISKDMPNSTAVAADMSKVFEIKRMVKEVTDRLGKIDILVNNAGVGYDALAEKIDIDTYHYIFDLDLVGPLVAMQQVIPIMRKHGGVQLLT